MANAATGAGDAGIAYACTSGAKDGFVGGGIRRAVNFTTPLVFTPTYHHPELTSVVCICFIRRNKDTRISQWQGVLNQGFPLVYLISGQVAG